MFDKLAGYTALGDAGRQLYEQLHDEYDFSAAEELVVLECCGMVDDLRLLESAKDRGLWVAGPGKGEVLNPAFAESRMLRSQLVTALKKVGVMEDGRGKHMVGSGLGRANALGRNR